MARLDAFTRAYIEAALWSTTDQSDEQGGEPLDANYGIEDIAPETMELIIEDCADFQERFGHLIIDEPQVRGEKDRWDRWGLAAHDFWLTREGHGAGFWDGDWPKYGDELTEAAKSYGPFELYVGDDDLIYGPPPEHYRNPPEWLKKRHPSLGRRTTNEIRYPKPTQPPHHHVAPRVADFSTLPEIIEHAYRHDGATHVLTFGSGATIYFPFQTAGGSVTQYEEARAWRERGYWHAPAAGSRKIVDQLPQGAQPIDAYLGQSGGQRAAEAFGRRTRWSDWEILDSIDKGNMITPEAEARAVKLAQLGFIDTTGTWRLTAKGRRVVDQRVPVAAEAKRSGRTKRGPAMTDEAVMDLAGKLAEEVGGNRPTLLSGGFRWSEPNASARFTTYSPEHDQKVVCVVSVFEDGSTAVDFFNDEGLSETNRYENIGHFTYGPGGFTSHQVDTKQMVEDINWVRQTVDGYAASWQQDETEVDESLRPSPRRRTHTPKRRRRAGRR